MIIDASVVLRGFFPEKEGQAAAQAILQAVRRKRIDPLKGKEILTAYFDLCIRTVEVSWQRVFELACTYKRSASAGAYLALAEQTGSKVVKGDRRLYEAVKDHLPWMLWFGDYSPS